MAVIEYETKQLTSPFYNIVRYKPKNYLAYMLQPINGETL